MKAFFSRLYLLISVLLPQFVQPTAATIDSLKGSYTTLPKELKSLSLLDGAIALKTKVIKRAYKLNALPSELNQESIDLINKIFYIIPGTEDFKISSLLDLSINKFVKPLITNLVFLEIRNKISPNLNISDFLDFIEKEKNNSKNNFKNLLEKGNQEITRVTILAALWYYKSVIQDFNYEEILKETLKKACDDIVKKTQNKKLKEKIIELKESAELIKKTDNTIQVEDDPNLTSKDDENYEKTVIEALNKIDAVQQHPAALTQTFNAKITINQKKNSFADCVETLMRNLINLLIYDTKSKELDIKTFPKAQEVLKKFYETYTHFGLKHQPEKIKFKTKNESDAYKKASNEIKKYNKSSQNSTKAYNDWAQLMVNIPGILYVEKSSNEVEKNDFEMEPTFVNLIIATNYLLGLGWFTKEQDYPDQKQEQNVSIFLKEHLPKFINLLKGSTEKAPEEDKEERDSSYASEEDDEDKEEVVVEEYGTLTINHSNGYQFSIHLTKDHGYIEYHTKIEKCLPEFLSVTELEKYPSLWFLFPIKKWAQNKMPQDVIYLFAQPIDDQNFIRNLPEQLPRITYPVFQLIKNQIDALLSDQDNSKTLTTLRLYKELILKSDSLVKIEPKEVASDIAKEAFNLAKTAEETNSNTMVQLEASELMYYTPRKWEPKEANSNSEWEF